MEETKELKVEKKKTEKTKKQKVQEVEDEENEDEEETVGELKGKKSKKRGAKDGDEEEEKFSASHVTLDQMKVSEKQLREQMTKEQELYVVLNKVNGTEVDAIFDCFDAAEKYLIRVC